jgi:hypothetical protein
MPVGCVADSRRAVLTECVSLGIAQLKLSPTEMSGSSTKVEPYRDEGRELSRNKRRAIDTAGLYAVGLDFSRAAHFECTNDFHVLVTRKPDGWFARPASARDVRGFRTPRLGDTTIEFTPR